MSAPQFRWRTEHTLVIAATLLAALLRFSALGELPPQAWIDEVWVSARASEIASGGEVVAHYGLKARGGGGDAGLPWLAVVPMLMGIQSIITSRVVTAAAGTIAVPVAYACLRELAANEFARRRRMIGVLAAGGLSTLLYQVILSRVGMEAGSMPVMYLFCVWQLQRGLNRNAWSGWALAGLAGGLMQYLGPHARFVLPVMAFMIIQAFITHAPDKRLKVVRGAALLTVAGVAACGWLIATFIETPRLLYGRGMTVTQGVLYNGTYPPVLAVALNALKMIASFNLIGDIGVRHNLPGAPMLDPVLSIGFVAGVIWMAGRLRRSAMARLLLAWLILLMLTSILTVGAPNFERSSGIVGAALGVMAVGWASITERLAGWMAARENRQRVRLMAGGLAAISIGWNITGLFVLWPQSPDLQEEFTTRAAVALNGLAARSASEPVFVDVITGGRDLPPIHLIFGDTAAKRASFQDCLPLVDGAPTAASYVVDSFRDVGGAAAIREEYPASLTVFDKLSLWEEGSVTLIEVPAGTRLSTPAFQPRAEFANGISLVGYEWAGSADRPGASIDLAIYWKVTAPIAADVTSFFHVHTTGETEVAPLAQSDGQPCNGSYFPNEWQPGVVIKDWISIPLPADLPPGDYHVLAGWYTTATQERIALSAADEGTASDRAVIGTFTVKDR